MILDSCLPSTMRLDLPVCLSLACIDGDVFQAVSRGHVGIKREHCVSCQEKAKTNYYCRQLQMMATSIQNQPNILDADGNHSINSFSHCAWSILHLSKSNRYSMQSVGVSVRSHAADRSTLVRPSPEAQ